MKSWTTINGIKIIRVLAGRSNVFLVSGNAIRILIDTSPSWQWLRLSKRLESLNIKHIDYLILTHTHFDHAGNASRIRDHYKARVVVHRAEAALLETGSQNIPDGTSSFTRFMVRQVPGWVSEKLRIEPCPVDLIVEERLDLNPKGLDALIIHTPGHSKGSVSIVIDNEIALVGDAMVGRAPVSVFPPFAEDGREVLRSWRLLLDTGCRLFLPSHGYGNSRDLVEKYLERWRSRLLSHTL